LPKRVITASPSYVLTAEDEVGDGVLVAVSPGVLEPVPPWDPLGVVALGVGVVVGVVVGVEPACGATAGATTGDALVAARLEVEVW
jgi:hypothetical protein